MYGIDLADSRRAISISVIQSASAPWVLDPATGGTYSLLQVDRLFGVWVVRSRLEPNTIVQRHLHSGPVAALTLAGHWGYPESGWACGPGDYLVENSGTIHSLAVLGNKGADILFTIAGSITYFDESGAVTRIEDWLSVLDEYTEGCGAQGFRPEVIGAA
jgi:2,4'-dihydroxyacetophenone dioxygenase